MAAAYHGHRAIVDLLIEKGADLGESPSLTMRGEAARRGGLMGGGLVSVVVQPPWMRRAPPCSCGRPAAAARRSYPR